MEIYFSCTLLSDIVLTSNTATEGFQPTLDYIPGSKFLGIAAGLYDESAQDTMDLFHNGQVKFGNAYPQFEGSIMYPMPFALFKDKINKDKVYIHHNLSAEDHKNLADKRIQLKQQRDGFISINGKYFAEIAPNFTIKSAYNSLRRKSEDSQMYGYSSIPKGLVYQFKAEVSDSIINPERIIKAIVGKKQIGRSRSAEYGLVEIQKIDAPKASINQNTTVTETMFVYAASDLCFMDEFGFCYASIEPKDFGFHGTTKVNYKKSQIKTRIYQSFNSKRNTANADIFVIQKGSVIAFEKCESEQLKTSVGQFQNEGLGQILYNPAFLGGDSKELKSPNEVKSDHSSADTTNFNSKDDDAIILAMLNRRKSISTADLKIEDQAETFANDNQTKFKNISNSQWGAIAGIAKSTLNPRELYNLLFDETIGFLKSGVAQDHWQNKADLLEKETLIVKTLGKETVDRDLLIAIAKKMPKLKN